MGNVDSEDVEELRGELAAARSEAERLEAEAANAAAEAEQARGQLQAAGDTIAAREREAAELRAGLEGESQRRRDAVARYAAAVLRAEPGLPPELVRGDTLEEVDASLEAARAVVGRVRSLSKARSESARAPAGAPPRAAPDLSGMSPEEKIRYGLSRREG
jgi:fused signal recognition particle receptor